MARAIVGLSPNFDELARKRLLRRLPRVLSIIQDRPSKYGSRQLVMKNWLGEWSQSKRQKI